MQYGANASVDYMVARIKAETTFVTTVETFLVERARLLAPPTLNMTAPTATVYKLNRDFSIRQGTGLINDAQVGSLARLPMSLRLVHIVWWPVPWVWQVLYLPEGGCDPGIGNAVGKIAVMKALERACGYVPWAFSAP